MYTVRYVCTTDQFPVLVILRLKSKHVKAFWNCLERAMKIIYLPNGF